MQFKERINEKLLKSQEIHPTAYLLGILSTFNNRYQTSANNYFKEVTWKQYFTLICIQLFNNPPILRDLAAAMDSSHQNVKQILNKLQKKGFIRLVEDEEDRRSQRVYLTEKVQMLYKTKEDGIHEFIQNLYQGISSEDLMTTIKTIQTMERNLNE